MYEYIIKNDVPNSDILYFDVDVYKRQYVDSDGDGYKESYVEDSDGDGQYDTVYMDTDGDGYAAVSYTHLDVYKRQSIY